MDSKAIVRVELDAQKLEQYHLTMEQIAQIVGAADFTIPAGSVTVGTQDLSVSADNSYEDTDALKTVPIALSDGNTIHLSDIAQVYEATEEADSIGRYNGEDVISIGIRKQQSATAIDVSNDVLGELDRLEAENPGIHFTVINDSSEMIESSISDVYKTVILAVLLAMVVIWLFCGGPAGFRHYRCFTDQLRCAGSDQHFRHGIFYERYLSDVSGIGVGMMVDNSINVLDGCFRAKERLNYYEAALEAPAAW
mgnify:CR=1 FL=1